jgi:inner membrane protease ATP23
MTDGECGASSSSNDTGYRPGEDSYSRWRNIFSILTGQMTPEGKERFRLDRDLRNEEADCKRCEKQRDYLFKYSLSDQLPNLSFLANISPSGVK